MGDLTVTVDIKLIAALELFMIILKLTLFPTMSLLIMTTPIWVPFLILLLITIITRV